MATYAPICTKCGREMRCKKNGYIIGFRLGRRFDSDRFECEYCGASVAILAQAPHPEPPPNGHRVKADCIVREDNRLACPKDCEGRGPSPDMCIDCYREDEKNGVL